MTTSATPRGSAPSISPAGPAPSAPSAPSAPVGSPSPARRTVLAAVLAMTAGSAVVGTVATAPRAAAAPRALRSGRFDVLVDDATGGVHRLSDPSDAYRTDFVLNPTNRPNFVTNDSRWLGDMVFKVRRAGEAGSRAAVTSLSDDVRTVTSDATSVQVAYRGRAASTSGLRDFDLVQTYRLAGTGGDQLSWTFTLTNTSGVQLEVLDVGFPLPMNSWWPADQTEIYEQRVARHSFVGQEGSYVYWQRPNGEAPYLVMVPQAGTSLEFKNKARYGEGPFAQDDPEWEGLVEYFVHSKDVAVARADRAAQYLPATSLVLEPGASRTYGFTFRWAASYRDMRDVLFDSGVVDVISAPGMVVPTDLRATLAVRAAGGITAVTGQTGKNITVTPQGTRNGYSVYQLTLPTLGANTVTVTYGQGRRSVLQYWATEPLEKVVAARAAFLTAKQQAKTTRGYDGAFLQWDMAAQKLITWDDYTGGGWKEWMAGGSDDLGLGPAAFLARKNVSEPVQAQVAAVDYFIQRFILGYLQSRTENGQRTWQVYRWFDGRDGTPDDQGIWRVYNYIHVANTYFHMYELKTAWPSVRTAFPAAEYLTMAYRTLEAMFTKVPLPNPIGDAAYDLGLMGEGTYPEILAALRYEGRAADATRLTSFIDVKRDRLFAQKYPFASEASIDTTGFETNYTIAKMNGNTALAKKVQNASMSCRGLQPLWYFYGGDNRHMGESWWNLGYETQLGAWQQQDYLSTYAGPGDPDFDDMLRVTHGAYIAGWANVNSGQISPAAANYGAASWQFQSEKGPCNYDWIPMLDGWWAWSGEADLGFWGGVRTATTTVSDDGVLGLTCFSGDVSLSGTSYTVVPKDGLRQRLRVYPAGGVSAEVERAKCSRAVVSAAADRVALTLAAPDGGASSPVLRLTRLAPGTYDVTVGGGAAVARFRTDGGQAGVTLASVPAGAVVAVARTAGAPGREVGRTAAASASFTAAWNRVEAVHDGLVTGAGATEQARLWGSYRPTARPASDQLTYTWPQAVTVGSAAVAFWSDAATGSGDGVALPQGWRLEHRDSAGVWKPVVLAPGAAYAVATTGLSNAVAFTPVTTTALRLVLTASASTSGSRSGVAVSEWAVFTA